MALSTGGRWSSEALAFIQTLAFAKARAVPEYMRASAVFTWQRRWTRMLSVVAVPHVTPRLPTKSVEPGHLAAMATPAIVIRDIGIDLSTAKVIKQLWVLQRFYPTLHFD